MKANWERIVWIVVLAFFLAFVFAALLNLVLLWPTFPEDWAFLLGFLAFWLLANKLLFGYGQFISIAELFLANREVDAERIKTKLHQPMEWLETLTFASLMTVWLNELDKYRYTYYATYLVIALLTLLTKLDLLGYNLVGNYLEGAFWGATIITFLVVTLEWIAHTYPTDLFAHMQRISQESVEGSSVTGIAA